MAQTERYGNTEIFAESQVIILENIIYATVLNSDSIYEELEFDLYLPDTTIDTIEKLPLVIFVHGGSFKGGKKESYDDWCLEFAKRGYAAVTINYRVGWNKGPGCTGDPADLNKAFYRSVQDTKAAIRFLTYFNDTYHIDADNIFLGGESAGAANILHTAFADDAELNMITNSIYTILGTADSSGNNYYAPYHIKGCMNKSGGLFSDTLIKNSDNIPVISFHGTNDNIVPIDTGAIFGCYDPVFFKSIFGSEIITNALDSLGFSYEFNYYPGGDHSDIEYPKEYMIERTALFFQNILLDNSVNIRQISALEVNLNSNSIYNCGVLSSATVEVTATNGAEPYQYSMDSINWSDVNTFNVTNGAYAFYVRDKVKNVIKTMQTFSDSEIASPVLNYIDTVKICTGSSVEISYTGTSLSAAWYKNDNLILDNVGSITINEPGNYYVRTEVIEGCYKNSNSVRLDKYEKIDPLASVESYVIGCEGEDVILQAEGSFSSYLWSNGNTGSFITLNEIEQSGNYKLIAIDNYGCENVSDYISVEIIPSATISISSEELTSFCQGETITLNAAHNGEFVQWKKNGLIIPGATENSYVANKSSTYTCVATGTCGEITSNSITITEDKLPKAKISSYGIITVCPNESVTLSALPDDALTFQWYKGAHEISGATAAEHTTSKDGVYKCLMTTITTGCSKFSNLITLTNPCRIAEEIPQTVIYPNPNNGIFYFNMPASENTSIIKVIDITGKIIFSSQ
ncbi:MAG: carboxylesterase family protein, partial [Fimbriimonadaceae bacterium]|nr:carboxylesterase family protein [Chitinophagales bacterium]